MLMCTYKPFFWGAVNGLIGIWLTLMINLTAFFTGIVIPVNIYSFAVVFLGGIPGTVLLSLSKYLFM